MDSGQLYILLDDALKLFLARHGTEEEPSGTSFPDQFLSDWGLDENHLRTARARRDKNADALLAQEIAEFKSAFERGDLNASYLHPKTVVRIFISREYWESRDWPGGRNTFENSYDAIFPNDQWRKFSDGDDFYIPKSQIGVLRQDFERWLDLHSQPENPGLPASTEGRKPPISEYMLDGFWVEREKDCEGLSRPPTEDEDWEAAKAKFPGNSIPRGQFRISRRKYAPKAWVQKGRGRKKDAV